MVDPILITGCARSGTSLTAGIINICGADGGKTAGPNNNNRKGMFENTDIRNRIVKPYLRRMGADPLGQNPLPKIDVVKKDAPGLSRIWKSEVLSIMEDHGVNNGNPWYYKGAKLCLIWPIWNDMFPNAKWVIVRREDYDIASSCLRTGFMRAFNRRGGWQVWIDKHKKRFEEMKKAGLDIIEFWPFKAVEGDLSGAKDMIEKLGLIWKEEEVKEFISPDLWHFSEERGV